MNPQAAISRRKALTRLSVFAAGSVLFGCTPARVALKLYPDGYKQGDLTERVLRAFVLTVIPGAPADDPNLTRIYSDDFYPFAPYKDFFAADLSRRAEAMFGAESFDELDADQRKRVIDNGLAADAITKKLYNGAILMGQVSVYAGIFDDERGCSLIDFDGRYRLRAHSEIGYDDVQRYLPACRSIDGNPA